MVIRWMTHLPPMLINSPSFLSSFCLPHILITEESRWKCSPANSQRINHEQLSVSKLSPNFIYVFMSCPVDTEVIKHIR